MLRIVPTMQRCHGAKRFMLFSFKLRIKLFLHRENKKNTLAKIWTDKYSVRWNKHSRPDSAKEARPSPYHYCSYFLGRHYHLTSIELWSAYFWSGNLLCAHSPANPTTARQECFALLDVSNTTNYSFYNKCPYILLTYLQSYSQCK